MNYHLSVRNDELVETIGMAETEISRPNTIIGGEPQVRNESSPADFLFADIIRAETRSDIAMLPAARYGVAIRQGPITAEALRNLIPHEGRVVVLNLRGGQIRDILEQSLENVYASDPRKRVGGIVQVSGMRFSYDPQGATMQRVRNISLDRDWFDLERSYRVATESVLADGGYNCRQFRYGEDSEDYGDLFGVVRRAIEASGRIRVPELDRIRAERAA
jgi:5'-nucleotidase / UDP-sugar diphosphatase